MTGCFELSGERVGGILVSSSLICKVTHDYGYYYLTSDGLYYLTSAGEKIEIEIEDNH